MGISQIVLSRYSAFLILTSTVFLLLSECAIGQSTYDLEPPLQAETETYDILMLPDPNAIPTYAFVVASLNEEGMIEITRSVPNQEPIAIAAAGNGIPYTENVTQTYMVQVPYTEIRDGQQVTKMRAETRTRTVPVTRFRKRTPEEQKEFDEKMAKEGLKKSDEEKPVVKQIKVPYVVQIPYVEEVDGKQVNKVRRETRMRIAQVVRGKAKTTIEVSKVTHSIADAKCFGVDGRPLDEAEIKKRLAEKAPMILIKDQRAITPYFESLLRPDAIFMLRPE